MFAPTNIGPRRRTGDRRRVAGAVVLLAAAVRCAAAVAPPPRALRAPEGIVLRVGLATDQADFELVCCQDGLIASSGGERIDVAGGLKVVPGGSAARSVFRLQAAALKDEDQARALAARLQSLTEAPSDAAFDVSSSLYRVRVGRLGSRDEAERLRQRYAERGLASAWVVEEGGGVTHPRLHLRVGDREHEVVGRWLSLEPTSEEAVRLESAIYRGRILLFLNDRGRLNVINELDLESYIRGVVPLEMGPELYDSLESLKAQAVAARTFAVRSFGGFSDEGFDVCAAPRCQVYGGLSAEHALSDRAVAETSGEVVVFEGDLAEALYSSSCGGNTENVEVVFPLKRAGYLRAVECPEAGVSLVPTRLKPGTSLASGVMVTLLSAPELHTVAGVQSRFEALARKAVLPTGSDRLASLDRRELRRYLASLFDIALDARLFRPSADALAPSWSSAERDLHARLAPEHGAIGGEALEELLLDLARVLGVVVEERGYFLQADAGRLTARVGGRRQTFELDAAAPAFLAGGAGVVAADLELAAGDRLRLLSAAGYLTALVREAGGRSGVSPRGRSWSHFRTRGKLGRTISGLYPGFELADLEVLERGASGRVARLRLHSTAGETVLLEGLSIRWTLGLPDTLFELRQTSRDGSRGWQFDGRGHGHGVGMCQLGAVAMSRRGQTYREILAHYYAGASLGRLRG
jgi:stage II sporulation protein D